MYICTVILHTDLPCFGFGCAIEGKRGFDPSIYPAECQHSLRGTANSQYDERGIRERGFISSGCSLSPSTLWLAGTAIVEPFPAPLSP